MSWVEWAWWATLMAGVLIAAVVWALLEALRRTVDQVARGADEVLALGGQVAQHTWTVQLFHATKAQGVALLEELRRQEGSGR